MSRFAHYPANTRGRDFAVGDIHGHFSRLQAALDRLDFDPARDRLFSVGDLVDRGPESAQVLKWLARPWFAAVQGNHEALAIQYVDGLLADERLYRACGGGWFIDSAPARQQQLAARFAELPLALEVESAQGLVGVVHADCPFLSWSAWRSYLQQRPADLRPAPQAKVEELCQWSRARLTCEDARPVADVRAVMVGHTPLRVPKVLGNVCHIDTAGWRRGYFTLVNLTTLAPLQS